jgi:hypothetical protein
MQNIHILSTDKLDNPSKLYICGDNGSRLGEVAEHKTSLVVQTLK